MKKKKANSKEKSLLKRIIMKRNGTHGEKENEMNESYG